MTTDKNVAVENVRTDGAKGQPQAGGIGSLLSLRSGIDQLFDDMFRGAFGTPTRRFFDLDSSRGGGAWPAAGVTVPSVNVAESADSFTITAEMPGLDEKDIAVSLAADVLTLKGERRAESEQKKQDYRVVERRYGAFHRAFRLPEGVAAEKISASCDKGVLTITLPKRPEKRVEAKKIEVRKK